MVKRQAPYTFLNCKLIFTSLIFWYHNGYQVINLQSLNLQLQEEADKARATASAALSRQRTLEESLALLEAEATERSRKFSLVQRSFRTNELEMKDQIEALTNEMNMARKQQAGAEAQSKQAVLEAESISSELRLSQQQLESSRLLLSRLEAELADQVNWC